jgi:hypothetical protein
MQGIFCAANELNDTIDILHASTGKNIKPDLPYTQLT